MSVLWCAYTYYAIKMLKKKIKMFKAYNTSITDPATLANIIEAINL